MLKSWAASRGELDNSKSTPDQLCLHGQFTAHDPQPCLHPPTPVQTQPTLAAQDKNKVPGPQKRGIPKARGENRDLLDVSLFVTP